MNEQDTENKSRDDKDMKNTIIKESIERAKGHVGRLSYTDLNEVLPQEVVSPAQIDDLIGMLGEKDIDIVSDAPAAFTHKTKACKWVV